MPESQWGEVLAHVSYQVALVTQATKERWEPVKAPSLLPSLLKLENQQGVRVAGGQAKAPHSSTLAWQIPWMEEPGRLRSMGSLRVGHD